MDFYGVEIKLCRYYRAQTKGKVESGVKYVKRNALAGRRFETLDDLNAWLTTWAMTVADERVHGTTYEIPRECFERDERVKMIAVDRRPPSRECRMLRRQVATDGYVTIETNRYPVPYEWCRAEVEVEVQLSETEVRIVHGEQAIGHYQRRGDREHTRPSTSISLPGHESKGRRTLRTFTKGPMLPGRVCLSRRDMPKQLRVSICIGLVAICALSTDAAAGATELVVPYVLTGGDYRTQVLLHNQRSDRPVTATILVRSLDDELVAQTVPISPKGTEVLAVSEMLGGSSRYKTRNPSIVVQYGDAPGAVTATVRIQRTGFETPLISRAINRQRIFGKAFAAAIWAPTPHSAAEIALHNASSAPISAQVTAASGRHSAKLATLALSAGETTVLDVAAALRRAGLHRDESFSYGLRIEHDGRPGDLVAGGALLDRTAHLWHPIAFTDLGHGSHDNRLRTQYVFWGSPPPSYGFPSGTSLHSVCVVYNPGAESMTVRPALKLFTRGGERAADLEPITLPGGATTVIDFDELRRSGLVPAGVSHGTLELAYDASAGRIVASLVALDESRKERTSVHRALSGHTNQRVAAEFWESDASANTIVVVSNVGATDDRVFLDIGSRDSSVVTVEQTLNAGEVKLWNFDELRRAGNLPSAVTRGWFAVRAESGVRAALFVERLVVNGSPFDEKKLTPSTRFSVTTDVYEEYPGDGPIVDDGSSVRVQDLVADTVEPWYDEGTTSALTFPLDITVYWTDGSVTDGQGATLISDTPYVSVDETSLSATAFTDGEGGWEGGISIQIDDACAPRTILASISITLSIRFSAYEYTGVNPGPIFDQCLWRATCTGACSTSGHVSVKPAGPEPCFDQGAPYLQCSDLLINGRTCFRKLLCHNTPFPGSCS